MRKALCIAALVAGASTPAVCVAAESFGRLFFTPAQRNALDAGRQIRTPLSSRAPAVPGPREVTLNGVVTRSDGESTVWVNGLALDRRASGVSARASGADPASAQIKLGGTQKSVRMRVGQQLESVSGKINEAYVVRAGRTEPAASPARDTGEEAVEKNPPSSKSETAPDPASGN